MFTAALFTIAKIWKQPKYPSTNEQIKKLWYTEGEQNMPPPNMPFWHMDYFELKAMQQTQEKLLPLP